MSREAEKRGCLVSQATGESQLLVLRCGTLRVYGANKAKGNAKRNSVPDSTLSLTHRCEVSLQPGNGLCLQIQAHVPYEAEHSFQAKSEDEAKQWVDALCQSVTQAKSRFSTHMEFLAQGGTAYKYNYSNSKRMRRHFWIDAEKVELCWGKSRSDEPQTISLKDSVGIIFGPMTTTFQRCATLEDLPWCCFSLLFPDRTLDLAVPGNSIEPWYLGLQHLLMEKSAGCVSGLSEAEFVFRKVFQKLRDSAHRQGFTTRTYWRQQLLALGRDAGFREALDKARAGASLPSKAAVDDAEAEAKAERRRKRRESKAEGPVPGDEPKAEKEKAKKEKKEEKGEKSSFAPPPRDGASSVPQPNPQQVAAEAEEQDLQRMVAELEKELESTAAKLEAIQPKWNQSISAVPFSNLGEALHSDNSSWQSETCSEVERELLLLQTTNKSMSRQLQAAEKIEKQLKKLAKAYKESDSQVQAIQQDLGSAEASARSSETAKLGASAALELSEAQTSHLERRVKELEQQLQQADKGGDLVVLQQQNKLQVQELSRLDSEKAELAQKVLALDRECKAVELRTKENEQRVASASSASRRLGESLRRLQGEATGLQDHQKKVREECEAQVRSLADSFPPLTGAVQNIGASTENLLQRYNEVAEERKKLHNLVLELKGNIRVFVRVRPINEKEKAAESAGEATITFAEDCKASVYDANQSRRKWFEFDKAFQPKTAQQEVFEEVKPLATSVLDGYNVCIFAYGQTGSGKTFTMTGNDANPGLNTRVLTELFRIRHERKEETEIKISLMVTEIYNETIKDLFNPESNKKKLDVKQNPDGSNTVPGLTELPVHSVDDVLKAMKEAQSNRTVMATDMNEESSRSHSIVQVRTVNVSKKDKREYIGKINLIDLAGSENVNKSGVQGQGMREAQNINKSLSALGDVISSLISKNPHVPYRNSKLTMMLKDSLGGDSKTLMIVQCSPAQSNVTETLSSLNFASRARNVELGKAKRNVKGSDDK